jgi:hypothetical protein
MGLLRPTAGEATIAAPDCWSSATQANASNKTHSQNAGALGTWVEPIQS